MTKKPKTGKVLNKILTSSTSISRYEPPYLAIALSNQCFIGITFS